MIFKATTEAINKAAHLLRQGELVAFPTETVYGLGADATNDDAVKAIFAAKSRPNNNPLIVHVKNLAMAEEFAEFTSEAHRLATAFWPGPLTLVLAKKENTTLSPAVTPNQTTIALRIPQATIAQVLLEACDRPIAAPSANRSGHVSPTQAEHVADDLRQNVAMILDGGPCKVGIESTVINMTAPDPAVLRTGTITSEAIEKVLAQPVASPHMRHNDETPLSPGLLQGHYAPDATLRLNTMNPRPDEALLAFGQPPLDHNGPLYNLSIGADLDEAAANLYAGLRILDRSGAQSIAVMPIPNHGIGEAINERLTRAAAPRR